MYACGTVADGQLDTREPPVILTLAEEIEMTAHDTYYNILSARFVSGLCLFRGNHSVCGLLSGQTIHR